VRVLVVAAPLLGHVLPLVPFATALVDGVALVAATATARPMREAALRLGVTTVPASRRS